MPYAEPEFFAYLEAMDMGSVKIHAVREGKFIFPKEPALTLEGPLGAVQIIESTIINLTSYPTLVCTNAVRMRVAAGRKTKMIEFGLRRGQGPVGATMGAKYAIMGTFEGTANTLLGFLSKGEIPITGTMAHSYVISFTNESDLGELRKLKGIDLVDRANHYRNELNWTHTNYSELLAFLNYASCNVEGYLALVDSYNTIESGVKNFLITALVLAEVGVKPVGIRLDSGDLSELSKAARKIFTEVGERYNKPYFKDFTIMASNEIHEDLLYDLQKRGHEIDNFGIGTNLITCLKQPALGMVYKLVSINGTPRIKLSEDIEKVTLPGLKSIYRVYLEDAKKPSFDVIALRDEETPKEGKAVEVVSKEKKKLSFTPEHVELLNPLAFDGKVLFKPLGVKEGRELIFDQLDNFEPAIIQKENPTAYPVYYSVKLYALLDDLIKRAKS
eukprot:TRINITY_DN1851_c0_g2_i10.p1 TRINITY_DN1851_c0_g2~~TRINITY_DN1851_c0_g2_i10.p1  ORF type:complete len:444 (-),score=116.27 TRINITY_DN1851_c0_g2_i10:175-1506(-)